MGSKSHSELSFSKLAGAAIATCQKLFTMKSGFAPFETKPCEVSKSDQRNNKGPANPRHI